MTVIIGLLCSDGGILACDSQGTDLQARVRIEVESKVFPLGTHVAWGLSGPEGLQQVLKESLDATVRTNWRQKTLSQIRMSMVDKVTGRQAEAVRQFVPASENARPPTAEVLLCGFTVDKWLLEITETGQQQEHFKFCAVGSAKGTAYHVWNTLKHYEPHDETAEFGKVLAYRVIDDVIRTEAVFVGFPIRMWVVQDAGVAEVTEPELDALGQLVEEWKKDESRSLRRVLEGRAESGVPAEDGTQEEPPTGKAAPKRRRTRKARRRGR